MSDTVLLRDMAMVVSPESFSKSIRGVSVPRNVRRIEFPVKITPGQRTVSDVTRSTKVNTSSIIVIPNVTSDVFYISFILDSSMVKYGFLESKVNIHKMQALPIPVVSAEHKEYFRELETILLSTAHMGQAKLEYEYFYTAERLFADIRDAIAFELYRPELLHAADVHLVEFWKQEILALRQSKVEQGFDSLVYLIDSLMKPGNLLYDNLKRFYLLVEKINKK